MKKFFKNVKNEMKNVRWPNKKEMITYSIATIFCIVVFALFFTSADLIIAGIRTLAK